MATNVNIYDLQTLAKTSVSTADYLETANQTTGNPAKILVNSFFPTFNTTGTSSENLWIDITNKNQLNFKGLKSGDTGLLTIATTSNNLVLTVLENGIDLSLCNNDTAGFLAGMDFTGAVTGECSVVNGGTGLSTITKGAVLYADADNSMAASSAMSTNGQLLIGNATAGYPSVTTLTAGSNMTITNGAGTITLAASLSTMAADLDMANYDIDLGTGWISGNGTHEGINIDSDGKVFIGEGTPTAFFDAALNIKGSLSFASDTAPTIKPVARSGSSGVKLRLEAGSASGAIGGDLELSAGSSTSGNHNGGSLKLYGGDEAGSGTAGSIQNFVSNGGGSEVQALTITGGSSNPNVTVDKGIVHTGKGIVTQATNHSTAVTLNATAGVITLAGVALAAGAEADFAVTNSTVSATSLILLTVQSPAAGTATDNATLIAQLDDIGSGSFNIRLSNPGAASTSTHAHRIHFLVIN